MKWGLVWIVALGAILAACAGAPRGVHNPFPGEWVYEAPSAMGNHLYLGTDLRYVASYKSADGESVLYEGSYGFTEGTVTFVPDSEGEMFTMNYRFLEQDKLQLTTPEGEEMLLTRQHN